MHHQHTVSQSVSQSVNQFTHQQPHCLPPNPLTLQVVSVACHVQLPVHSGAEVVDVLPLAAVHGDLCIPCETRFLQRDDAATPALSLGDNQGHTCYAVKLEGEA